MAEGIPVGGLYVVLGGEASALNTMIANAQEQFKNAAAAIQGAGSKIVEAGAKIKESGIQLTVAGAALTGTVMASARAYAQASDSIGNMSIRTGIAVEALSELEYATAVSGSSLEMFEHGVRRMQNTLGAAAAGSKEAQRTFARLGIPMREFSMLAADKQFEVVADAIASLPNPTARARASMELFGRESTKLLPLMEKGGAGIRALREEAERLGYALTTEDVKAGKEFDDSLSAMYLGLKRIYFAIGKEVAPIIKEYANYIRDNIGVIKDWIHEHAGLFKALLIAGFAITALGTALIGISTAVSILNALVGTAKLLWTGLSAIFSAAGFWTILILGVSIAVLFLDDSLREMFGYANTGFANMVNNWRVGGFKIATWATVFWLQIFKGWEYVQKAIRNGWADLGISITSVGSTIYRFMIDIFKGIGNTFYSLLADVASRADSFINALPGGGNSNLSGGVYGKQAEMNQQYDKLTEDSLKANDKRWAEYYAGLIKTEEETKKKVGEYNKSISDLFLADAMERFELERLDEEKKRKKRSYEAPGLGLGMDFAGTESAKPLDTGTFKQMSLLRFSLPSPATSSRTAVQPVRAPGVEERLDTLTNVVRSRPSGLL